MLRPPKSKSITGDIIVESMYMTTKDERFIYSRYNKKVITLEDIVQKLTKNSNWKLCDNSSKKRNKRDW